MISMNVMSNSIVLRSVHNLNLLVCNGIYILSTLQQILFQHISISLAFVCITSLQCPLNVLAVGNESCFIFALIADKKL